MKKILTVINETEEIEYLIERSISLSMEQDAVLEVLFVHETPLFNIPDFFLSLAGDKKSGIDTEKIRNSIKEKLASLGYEEDCAIFVYIDDTADRAALHAEDDSQTLIVSKYHKNITEELLSSSPSPSLVLKGRRKRYDKISMPIELDGSAQICLDTVMDLFSGASISLIYDNHYLTDREEAEVLRKRFEEFKTENSVDGEYMAEFAWNEADYGEDFSLMEKHLTAAIEKSRTDLTVLCSGGGDFIYPEAVCFALLHSLDTDFLFSRNIRS